MVKLNWCWHQWDQAEGLTYMALCFTSSPLNCSNTADLPSFLHSYYLHDPCWSQIPSYGCCHRNHKADSAFPLFSFSPRETSEYLIVQFFWFPAGYFCASFPSSPHSFNPSSCPSLRPNLAQLQTASHAGSRVVLSLRLCVCTASSQEMARIMPVLRRPLRPPANLTSKSFNTLLLQFPEPSTAWWDSCHW